MAVHNEIGKIGEEIAAKLMQQKGFRVVERNWKFGHLEMDIIAVNKDTIAFVEVKTRTSVIDKRPEEYVDILKRRRMAAAASAYIRINKVEKAPRFDVVGIILDAATNTIKEISHFEDAFLPPMKTISRSHFNGVNKWHHRSNVIGKK